MLRLNKNVPEEIKKRVEAITRRFVINGLCDPMYIANVIGDQSGCGNGMGDFICAPEFTTEQCKKIAIALRHAYGCNIFDEDMDELEDILKTGRLSSVSSIAGLHRFIARLTTEIETTKYDYRKDFCEKQRTKASAILSEIISAA